MKLWFSQGCVRPANEMDAKQLAKWWQDGRVMAHAGFPKGLHTNIEKLASQLKTQTNQQFIWIIENSQGDAIGEMNHKINQKSAMIGIKICDFSHQEKGIGTAALKALIDYLFTRFALHQITLDTMIENMRARHVYQKLYFKEQTIKKDCWTDQLGQLRTAVVYQLTRSDYLVNQRFFKQKECL